jgi:co-chaperonin GroES (HSP10)
MIQLRPIQGWLAIRPVAPKRRTRYIILPKEVQTRIPWGIIEEISPSIKHCKLKPGDRVMYSSALSPIEHCGIDIILATPADIQALYIDKVVYPVGDRYIIKPVPIPEKKNGVYIPEEFRDPNTRGEIVSTPQDLRTTNLTCGTKVIYSSYAAGKMGISPDIFHIIRKHDIISTL